MINARTVSVADKTPDERTVERAENLVCAFARIRVQDHADAAANLSEATYSLQAAVGPYVPSLTIDLREELIAEIRAAAPIIHEIFAAVPAGLIERCVRSLLFAVDFWAMSPDERRKSRHLMTDATAYVRWLRNAAHNQVLLRDIDERARKRRIALVRALASVQELCYEKMLSLIAEFEAPRSPLPALSEGR